MEMELGLKITHTRDDITSFTDLRISKDRSGPVFVSRETDTKFILIAYLKGFRRENLSIKINGEGDRLEISGEKPVQEMVMVGWIMYKKDVELRAFRKVFRIPDAVVLDRIKAKFNDDEAVLTVSIPKSEKGIRGVSVEEVKDEFGVGGSSSLEDTRKILDSELPENDEAGRILEEEDDDKEPGAMNPKPEEVPNQKDSMKSLEEEDQGHIKEEVVAPIQEESSSEAKSESNNKEQTAMEEKSGREEPKESKEEEIVENKLEISEMAETKKTSDETRDERVPNREPEENKTDDEAHMEGKGMQEHESEKQEHEANMEATNSGEEGKGEASDQPQNDKGVSKSSKICRPVVVAGSSILVSIIVMVIGFIRSRRKKIDPVS